MKLSILELGPYILKKTESKLIDLALPETLIGIWDEEKYITELYFTISEFLPNSYVYQIEYGVVHFKCYYGHDDETGYVELEDEIDLSIDLGLVFKEAAGLEKEPFREYVEKACFDVNRRTPLYKYIEYNLEDALTYLEFGWWNPEKSFAYTEGIWNGYVEIWEKICIKRMLVPGIYAVPFFKLEGKRQVVVSQDNLEKWGITEDDFFERVLLQLTARHLDSIPLSVAVLETLPLIKYFKIYDPKVSYGLSPIFAPRVAPGLKGKYGNVFSFIDPWNGISMMIDHKGSYMTSIATLYLHIKKHVKYANPSDVFAFKIYWSYQGVIREVNIKKLPEDTNELTIDYSEFEQKLFGISVNITPNFSGN